MKIASVAGVFPDHYYSQTCLLAKLRRYWADRLTHPTFLERLHHRVGVHGRYLALAVDDYYHLTTWGQANGAWNRVAQELGERVATIAAATSRNFSHLFAVRSDWRGGL